MEDLRHNDATSCKDNPPKPAAIAPASSAMLRHDQVMVGSDYLHKWDGKNWHVNISTVFYEEDRERWGWTGILANGQSASGNCWGWVSELRPLSAESKVVSGLNYIVADCNAMVDKVLGKYLL